MRYGIQDCCTKRNVVIQEDEVSYRRQIGKKVTAQMFGADGCFHSRLQLFPLWPASDQGSANELPP
jgi:hypothetical protein